MAIKEMTANLRERILNANKIDNFKESLPWEAESLLTVLSPNDEHEDSHLINVVEATEDEKLAQLERGYHSKSVFFRPAVNDVSNMKGASVGLNIGQ